MSEFKFACPVCGQHITADSSTSGGHIDCPTCFRKIVVPQAPASTDAKLIISASQADRPRPPQGSTAPLDPSTAAPKRFPLVATFVVVLLLVGAAAFAFRDRIFVASTHEAQITNNSPATAPGAPLKRVYPIPTDLKWTLDLSKESLPDRAAVGSIHGTGFKCERAILQGGNLTLRQGRNGADLAVTIHLFAKQGEELGGKSIEVTPERAPPLPRVVLRWKDQQGKAVSRGLNHGYALKLVFGEPFNGRMAGRIYLCTPDDAKSFVAGSFNAELRKPAPPKSKQSKTSKVKSSG